MSDNQSVRITPQTAGLYKLGVVVQPKDILKGIGIGWTFGHIVGFSVNSTKETVLIVLADDETRQYIHPGNVVILSQ